MKFVKVFLILFIVIFWLGLSYAEWSIDNEWNLIPKWDEWKAKSISKDVWSQPWKVWDKYNEHSKNIDVWTAFASWVFSWDVVFDYFKYIAQLLSKLWLVIWAWMIIYAWYKYTVWVFTQDTSKSWKDTVKWAIYWLLIIIFSYAIMKILMSMFW